MKSFIEWLEGDTARGRKVVLITTIFVYLILSIAVFSVGLYTQHLSTGVINVYMILTGLIASIYAFYTGTSSDKSAKLADKAADIMLKKLSKVKGD